MTSYSLVLLVVASLQSVLSIESIDTIEPIIRTAPASLDPDSYFGFSAVLHRYGENMLSFTQYLESTRIVVSAPNGSAVGAEVPNTGVVYTCPVGQGECTPLVGDGAGADQYLYDVLANEGTENKSKQFLGVSMDSADNMFLVCAHRYFNIPSATRYPRGRCIFTTDRTLQGFQVYQPCHGRSNGNFGQCQSGTSALFADTDTTDGDDAIRPMIVGAPGTRSWQGAIFRRRTSGSTDFTGDSEGTDYFNWQGYAMTKGRFISTTREDIAVSVPRANNYFGRVNIIRNNNGLDFQGQTLVQTNQMAEYYGFSLAVADLNGDMYDELLVGAPMYSPSGTPEAGEVYIYNNNKGNLEFFRRLTAPVNEEYARFGHAITNLGDVNGDGLDDIAISAPFGEGSGKVYVYYGSVADTLTPTVQQTIIGTEVTEDLSGVVEPRGFGYSLSSSLDVDGNGIRDLLIGAQETQQVFLLRTRAVANIPVTISAQPNIVNLDNLICPFESVQHACFDLTACATFPSGTRFADNTELQFEFVVDRQNTELGLEQRAFFNNSQMLTRQTVNRTADQGEEICITERVYIINNINDRFNGFPVDVTITNPQFVASSTDGNPNPTNLASFPVIITSGLTALRVETFKDCNGGTCIPDLALSPINVTFESSNGSSTNSFIAGEVANFNIWMDLINNGEDAFLTTISFSILTAQFEFIRILPRQSLITCTSEVGNERTVLTCPIANPLGYNTRPTTIGVRLRPTNGLRPSEGPFMFTFTASSINDENATTISNNNFTRSIDVSENADIFLDKAIADPEQLSYTNANITEGSRNITAPEDLGPPVTVSFVVRNAGPSTVPETRVRIFWPLREDGNDFYYLYPSEIQRSLSNSIDCAQSEEEYINPLQLTIQSLGGGDDAQEGGEEGISAGKKRRRRRSISPLKRTRRNIRKRQTLEAVDEVQDVVINCRTNPELCVEIQCIVRQLAGGDSVQLDIVSHLDERYFQSRTDRFSFVPYANVSIVRTTSSIEQPNSHLSDETEVQIRAVTSVPPPRRRDSSVAWWIIVVPVILALLFFIILGVILYFVGFFRRKNKEKKEEIAAQFLEAQQGGDVGFDDPSTPQAPPANA